MTSVAVDVGGTFTDVCVLDDDSGDIRVAKRYREGELDTMDAIRRHGVILDWGTGELLECTTEQFRAMLERRAADHWNGG